MIDLIFRCLIEQGDKAEGRFDSSPCAAAGFAFRFLVLTSASLIPPALNHILIRYNLGCDNDAASFTVRNGLLYQRVPEIIVNRERQDRQIEKNVELLDIKPVPRIMRKFRGLKDSSTLLEGLMSGIFEGF